MRIRRSTYVAVALAVILPAVAAAQSSSINSFSPYTLYGLGDITTPGTAYMRSMGGAGSAFRNYSMVNYLNPAAASASARQSFLLNFGLEGQNYYLKDGAGRTSSYNSFSIRDVAIQMPIASRIGFGVSVTPFSTVGYRIEREETDPAQLDNLRRITYKYAGSGGITQLKAALGVAVTDRLSLGAEMVYYLGNINRAFAAGLTSYNGEALDNVTASETNRISRMTGNFGIQYNALMSPDRILTLSATYQPELKLNPKVTRYIPSNDIAGDTVLYTSNMSDFKMPQMITAGVFYQTNKLGLGFDYSWQDWAVNNNGDLSTSTVNYRSTSAFKIGGQYTPNRLDVRHFMNRLTYRAGFRQSDYYMTFNGYNITERAVTFGVGIPMRMAGMSAINVGLEAGTRGSTRHGLVRENFFKVSIGLSLFGEDDWFVKPKYD